MSLIDFGRLMRYMRIRRFFFAAAIDVRAVFVYDNERLYS